jgi:hypothetical protein
VDESERDMRLLQSAAVILSRSSEANLAWAHRTLARNPGARFASIIHPDGRATVVGRDREPIAVRFDTDETRAPADSALLPSAIYVYEVSGRIPATGKIDVMIRVGTRRLRIRSNLVVDLG